MTELSDDDEWDHSVFVTELSDHDEWDHSDVSEDDHNTSDYIPIAIEEAAAVEATPVEATSENTAYSSFV
jgi:hypothetical protein